MSAVRHFCTLFDRNYLLKGVVMLTSLERHCPSARIFVLCMDEVTHRMLSSLSLPQVSLLRLSDVEDEELLRVKPGRSVAEYCWTLSPALCRYVLSVYPDVEMITYLDADLMFFSDVGPLFDEIGNASIVVIEHRFASKHAHLEACGRFNVEWVGFRRTRAGLECLNTWRSQCIDWCFARREDDRLGDQKYLDAWPDAYPADLHILKNAGAGLAPWNFSDHSYAEGSDLVLVDGVPLIFYHFNQFQLIEGGRFDYMSATYAAGTTIPVAIYGRYEVALTAALAQVRAIECEFSSGIRPAGIVRMRRFVQRFVPIELKNVLRRFGIQSW